MHFTKGVIGLCAAAALGSRANAGSAEFIALPDLGGGAFACTAQAVSDDGRTVVGQGTDAGSARAVRWFDGEVEPLGSLPGYTSTSLARAVSADGSVIVGIAGAFPTTQAFRWQAGSFSGLGHLSGFELASNASGISSDGQTIVGWSYNTTAFLGCRWVNGVLSALPDIPGGLEDSAANDTNSNGSIIAGRGRSVGFEYEACRWNSNLFAIPMGDLAGGRQYSEVEAMNNAGNVFVGYANDASVTGGNFGIAARWLGNGPCESLGDLDGGARNSYAFGVSDDGASVVGYGTTDLGVEAFLWRQGLGMSRLRTVLESEFGLDLTGWRLTVASDITPDGRIIVGTGVNPNGQSQAWMVRISPVGCPGDFNSDGTINTSDLTYLLVRFGSAAAPGEPSDLNGDGQINTSDLVSFLVRFGQLC